MYKQKIVLCILFAFASYITSAQVGVSAILGCAPLTVSFTAPPNATSASWNFGNGTSTNLNPVNIFGTPGVYNVTYSGVGGSPTSSVITINVVQNAVSPTYTFSIPPTHCAPMSVGFTATGPPGSTYQWAFGDGGSVSGNPTNHTFNISGIFSPTLTVTNPAGCAGIFINGPINVSNIPQLNIAATPGLNACAAPFSPSFSGSLSTTGSPLGGSLTYNWTFGNSQSSNSQNPGVITYNSLGSFLVTLTSTDNNNCTGSTTQLVTINQPTLVTTAPGTICAAGQQTTSGLPVIQPLPSAQSSQPFTTWQMGDGNTVIVNTPNPGVPSTFTYNLYTTPGLKTLTITATAGNCVATQTRTIFVAQISPQFTFTSPSFTCMPSMVASFVNQSTINTTASLSYFWMVNHWSVPFPTAYGSPLTYTSNAVDPTFTLTVGSLNPYAYYGMYVAQAHLFVSSLPGPNMQGCSMNGDIYKISDTIWRPTAMFKKSKKEGCLPLMVTFTDISDIADLTPSMYPMTSYTWNNGASPATTSVGSVPPAIVSPTFVYSSAGTYTPFLAFTTAGGCSDISYVDTIRVVSQPTVGPISVSAASACVGTPVTVSMTAAPNPTLMQHWHVESDVGFFSGCVTYSTPTWFFTHTGVHGFTVTSYEHSCKTESVEPQTILIRGPVAKLRFTTNCDNRTTVDFSSYLNEAQTATLSYGDNTSDIIAGNPNGIVSDNRSHVYTSPGDYTVTLNAENPMYGCSYSHTVVVKLRALSTTFSVSNASACKADYVGFDARLSKDVYSTCIAGYTWQIDDTIPTLQSSSPIFATNVASNILGSHVVKLIVHDINGCTSTAFSTFTIGSPVANFTFPSPVCISDMPVQFINTTSQALFPVANFTWNFGATANTVTTSINDPPLTYNYTAAIPGQNYVITLIAQSTYTQCTDTMRKTLQVLNPYTPEIYTFDAAPCLNARDSFNIVNGGFTYSVNFGDGSPIVVSNAGSLGHTFTNTGVYSPSVSIASGVCVNTVPLAGQITVPITPTASFLTYSVVPGSPPTNIILTNSVLCSVANITFSSNTAYVGNLAYSWSITGLSAVDNLPTASVGWGANSVYTVSLGAYPQGSPKCPGVTTKTFTVLKPMGGLVLDKEKFCLGETIYLSLKDTSNVKGWVWVLNGVATTHYANSVNSPSIAYTYTDFPLPSGSGLFSPVELFDERQGVSCRLTASTTIQVIKVDADFKRNAELASLDSIHCLNITDQFNNKSKLNNSTSITALNFDWKFGDGASSASVSPVYIYPKPGVYTITLTVVEPFANCKAISTKNMTINPIPDVSISAIDSVCRGSTFQLSSTTSSDVNTYEWLPVTGLATPNASVTTGAAFGPVSYSLIATNIYGCKNTSKAEYIFVQTPPPSFQWDTTVVIGEPILLNTNLGPNYSYTWTPPLNLTCLNCLYPISTATADITYTVQVQDNLGCFRTLNTYSISIDPKTTIDVPTAFTPNGDGTNDIIYVDGWGIKRLNYFRIYNRWGQLLFESNDITVGWDGTFNGVPQNMETYVYQVSAETYLEGKSLEKASSFRLIR